jgi:hypothetical protein
MLAPRGLVCVDPVPTRVGVTLLATVIIAADGDFKLTEDLLFDNEGLCTGGCGDKSSEAPVNLSLDCVSLLSAACYTELNFTHALRLAVLTANWKSTRLFLLGFTKLLIVLFSITIAFALARGSMQITCNRSSGVRMTNILLSNYSS